MIPKSFVWKEREVYLQKAILTFVKPEMTFIDAGANDGYYSYLAANVMEGRGRVVSFEPNPESSKLLQSRIARSSNTKARRDIQNCSIIELHEKAIWNEAGEAQFYRSPKWNGVTSSLFKNKRENEREAITVPTVRVDEVVDRFDFCKIDIEGSEYTAIQGLEKLVSNGERQIIWIELHWVPRSKNNKSTIIHDFAQKHGCDVHVPYSMQDSRFGIVIFFKGYDREAFWKRNLVKLPIE